MMTINQHDSKQDDDDDEEEEEEEVASFTSNSKWEEILEPCTEPCRCCFPPTNLITWTPSLSQHHHQQQQLPGDVSIPPS